MSKKKRKDDLDAKIERVQEFVTKQVMEFQKDRAPDAEEAWMRIGLMEAYFRAWMDQCSNADAIRALYKGTCQ